MTRQKRKTITIFVKEATELINQATDAPYFSNEPRFNERFLVLFMLANALGVDSTGWPWKERGLDHGILRVADEPTLAGKPSSFSVDPESKTKNSHLVFTAQDGSPVKEFEFLHRVIVQHNDRKGTRKPRSESRESART